MRFKFLKVLLSYFFDLKIEERSSKYSNKLELFLRNGRYLLCSPNAVYSYEDLYINFLESFNKIELKQDNSTVLILGMGMGSIPLMLEKKFKKKYKYQAVEIDEEIINLTEKYILSDLQTFSKENIFCGDAIEFIKETKKVYDFIIIDLFIDNEVPSLFMSKKFLEEIEGCLALNGLLMFNQLCYDTKKKKKNLDYFEKVFKQKFQEAIRLEIVDNSMLFSHNCLKK